MKDRPQPQRARAAGAPAFVPWRTDVIYRAVALVANGNPLLTGFAYFLVEFIGTYVIGLATGQFYGKDGLPPMYSRYLDNLNMALLAPVGAGLLCHLYNSVSNALQAISDDELVPLSQREEYGQLVTRCDRLYNSIGVTVAAFVIGLGINLFNYITKTDSWLGINGGITGAYGRLFVGFNYVILSLMIYKCGVTIWVLRRILNLDVKIRPFHPDRAGGLKPIGRLAIAVNYFVSLIVLFFTLTLIYDEFAQRNLVYLAIFLLFYPMAIVGFFASLSGAHRRMAAVKEDVLQRLDETFEHYYERLMEGSSGRVLDVSQTDEVLAIRSLYAIADEMPVWPFDTRNMVRFLSTIMFPIVIFVINLVTNADSILYNLDKVVVP
jgi:hypothetical protein